MTDTFTHETYLSPYTWRYGSDAMRTIWSLAYERRLWRKIWVALAEAQQTANLTTAEQVADLRAHMDNIDLERTAQHEAELRHDLMAEVHTYAEQCTVGGGVIHLGATSMDVKDNADVLRIRDSLTQIITALEGLLGVLANQIEATSDLPTMAFTHLQPAEPTTVGYRLAFYAQDWLADLLRLRDLRDQLRGKGFKGAVGTFASYGELLKDTDLTPITLEQAVMESLGLPAYDVTHQTYTRRQDWEVVNALAGIAMTANKFAFDLRLLQSPPIGEWAEPFGKKQIGSSAMPFKRNPIHAENISSLTRHVATLPRILWDDAAFSLLERTLDDSANRRSAIPEAFLMTDEILKRLTRLIDGLTLNRERIATNFATYGVFAATERLLMACAKEGGDRQELHEVIRQHSMTAWQAIAHGEANPLADLLAADVDIVMWVGTSRARELLDASAYVGEAPARAHHMAAAIRDALA